MSHSIVASGRITRAHNLTLKLIVKGKRCNLENNPTLNQIRAYEDESTKTSALFIIPTVVTKSIFTRIKTCETRKEA